MSILAIIPARSGSTRIKDKNLKQLGDKTLVQWAAKAAHDNACDRVVVSTDKPELACGEEFIIRPSSISGANADISKALQHTLLECERSGDTYEWVVTLQPTIPCRPHLMIKHMLNAMMAENAMSAVTAVQTVPWMWRCYNDETAANSWHPGSYPRSQDFENTGCWMAELNCITVTHHSIIREGNRWGLPLLLCALPSWATVDIDTESDLEDAQERWDALSAWMDRPIENFSYRTIHQIKKY